LLLPLDAVVFSVELTVVTTKLSSILIYFVIQMVIAMQNFGPTRMSLGEVSSKAGQARRHSKQTGECKSRELKVLSSESRHGCLSFEDVCVASAGVYRMHRIRGALVNVFYDHGHVFE
jgi:hypothetical protein